MTGILTTILTVCLYVIVFFLGASIGSFSLVVLRRSDRGEPWIKGRSHCETCGKTLQWYELIPFFSYLFLGGKCSGCKTKIPPSHFVCETGLGTLFAVLFHLASMGKTGATVVDTVICFAVVTVFWVASVSDVLYREANVLPMIVVGAAAGIWNMTRDWKYWYVFAVFVAAIVLLEVLGKKDNLLMLGMGDLYAAACILAIRYDFFSLVNIVGFSCLIGVVVHIGIALFSKKDITVPFIPYLFIGLVLDWFGISWVEAVKELVYKLSSM